MSTKGELKDCQSHHPEVTLVVVAVPLSRHFPPRLERTLAPQPSKLAQDKAKAEQPTTAGSIASTRFIPKEI